jgi:CheY-like chemotaxis protein
MLLHEPQIAAQLKRHGYHVVETDTVEQTLAAAHKGVEAILLDTSLDGMNGWEILPMLRRLDPEAKTPIVLLSIENRTESSKGGSDPFRRSGRLGRSTCSGKTPCSANWRACFADLASRPASSWSKTTWTWPG